MKHFFKKVFELTSFIIVVTLLTCCGNVDYREAVRNKDFDDAHKALNQMVKDYERVWEEHGPGLAVDNAFYNHTHYTTIYQETSKLVDAIKFVVNAEAREILASKISNEERINKLEQMFNSIPMVGEKLPSGTPCSETGFSSSKSNLLKANGYILSSNMVNELCDMISQSAIEKYSNNDAQEIVKLVNEHRMQPARIVDHEFILLLSKVSEVSNNL